MNGARQPARWTVVEVQTVADCLSRGLQQVAREIAVWTDPWVSLFFDKQRLRAELESAREAERLRRRSPLERGREQSPGRDETNWPGEGWPLEADHDLRGTTSGHRAPQADLPPSLDGWESDDVALPGDDDWNER